MKKLHLSYILFFISFQVLFAQQFKVDSLQGQLNKTKDDSRKIFLLNEISKNYFLPPMLDTVKAKAALDKMKELSLLGNNLHGQALVMLRQSSLLRNRKDIDAASALLDNCNAFTEKNNLYNEMAESMVMKAFIFQSKKKTDDAFKLFHEALAFARKINNSTQLMGAYRGLGFGYYSIADYDSSIYYYTLLRNLSCSINDINFCAHSNSMLGIMYSMRGNYTQAISANETALAQYERAGWKGNMASVINNLANSCRYLGKLEDALQYYYKAIALAEELNDSSQLASPIFAAADILKMNGQRKKANDYYQRSLAISIAVGNKNKQAVCYGGLGDMYSDDNELDSALACHKRALSLFNETNDNASIPQSMVSVAQVYLRQRKYDEAMRYLTDAKPMLEAAGLRQNVSLVYRILGELNYDQGKLEEARDNYLKAFEIANEIDYIEAKRTISKELSMIFSQLGNYRAALEYAEISRISNDSLVNREGIKSMQELTEKYESEKKEQQIGLLQKQRLIAQMDLTLQQEKIDRQELLDKEKTNQLALISKDNEIKGLEVSRQGLEIEKQKEENEKKKSELALLQKDNEIKTANELSSLQARNFSLAGITLLILFGSLTYYRYRQRKALSEKLSGSLARLKETQQQLIETERLREQENIRLRVSRDLHDDIGSTLSSINMLSSTAKRRLEEKDDKKLFESLEKIGERTQNTLDNMSDIIWSIKPGNDSLSDVLSRMREYAGTVFESREIKYSIDFPAESESIHLPLTLRNNLFLIFKEAVNNLAKYSQCTEATISLKIQEGKIRMTIADNGIGFVPSTTLSHGNGLINMKRRAEESGAVFHLSSSEGKGTSIHFTTTV